MQEPACHKLIKLKQASITKKIEEILMTSTFTGNAVEAKVRYLFKNVQIQRSHLFAQSFRCAYFKYLADVQE